jgi:3-hydroxypropanoate dehydrogenase
MATRRERPTEPAAHGALDEPAKDLLFREAHTATTFTGEPVTDDDLREILELIKWGPTAMNSQPLRLLALRSREARERLVPLMSEGNRDKTSKAPMTLIAAADSDFHEHLPTTFPHRRDARESLAAHPGRENIARFNASIQLGYLIVGIRAIGLAAGPMAGFDAEGVKKKFLADTNQHPLAVVNIGRPGPDSWSPRNPRLDFGQVVTTL